MKAIIFHVVIKLKNYLSRHLTLRKDTRRKKEKCLKIQWEDGAEEISAVATTLTTHYI